MDLERSESRKRRRPLSERRRLFSRIGPSNETVQRVEVNRNRNNSLGTPDGSSWSSSTMQLNYGDEPRSDSPVLVSGDTQIPIKIQFHITLPLDNEPLILSEPLEAADTAFAAAGSCGVRRKSSISGYIHDRLSRHNSSSTKRRQQLLAMHKQSALDPSSTSSPSAVSGKQSRPGTVEVSSEDNLVSHLMSNGAIGGLLGTDGRFSNKAFLNEEKEEPVEGRSVRSSTITGGRADEDTRKFLARAGALPLHQRRPNSIEDASHQAAGRSCNREHIYFKRDGQRFGQECTVKLAVDKTYRCLVKLRPQIPVQSISVQGQQVQFVDCSRIRATAAAAAAATSRSWQNVSRKPTTRDEPPHQLALYHANTTSNLAQLQQNQMMRQFAASHCSPSSAAQLGSSQLIYMFDWSASRFEVNKNKRRTQINTVLQLKNGQSLSLPLQVKFYQADCRQHLSWGSQLHFIDYSCSMAGSGLVSLNQIQYY